MTRRRFRPASTRLGSIRRWLWIRIFRHESETCDRCGGRVPIAWWCDDRTLWRHAYHHATGRWPQETCPAYDSGLLCPRCFERAARACGVVVQWHAREMGGGV